MQSFKQGLQFGDKKAPWNGLRFDGQGYLYLKLQISPDGSPAYSDYGLDLGYMVISPNGEYLGITNPPTGRSTIFSNGRLLVNYYDSETGECTLTVYDIRPIARGLEYPN
jgi:hypothetical protein